MKSSGEGWHLTVLFAVQLLTHSAAYCNAIHPRPGLSESGWSLEAVLFLLMSSTMSFAGFPASTTTFVNFCKKQNL